MGRFYPALRPDSEVPLRIIAISDTHGSHAALDHNMPEGNVLVHAGDLTSNGKLSQWIDAAAWLEVQTERYDHVVCIAGNHDWAAQAFMTEGCEKEMREKIFPKVHYLRDSDVTLDGVSFYGSPWTPRFFDWAFNADRGLVIKQWTDMIPMGTTVLITHGPPAGVLDWVGRERVGCGDLKDAVSRVRPRAHIFGHIHCAHGQVEADGTHYVNASVLNDQYRIAHLPTVIEI